MEGPRHSGERSGHEEAPTISIIAALHDAEPDLPVFLGLLEKTVRAHTELVLIDDRSQDGTLELVRRWAQTRPGVTVLANPVRRGVAESRNRALATARGEFVWFVDHDDRWDPRLAERMLIEATAGVDIVVCRADYRTAPHVPGRIVDGIGTSARVTGSELISLMLLGRVHGFLWSKLFRRTVLGTSPFPDLSSQSDVAGVAAVMGRARQAVLIPDVLYHYVNRAGSITRVREPRLENLRRAHDAVLAAAVESGIGTTKETSALTDYFTAWFYCRALILTPVRQRSSAATRRLGRAMAREALARLELRSLRAYSVSTWLFAVAVRSVPGPLLSLGARAAYRGKDFLDALGARASRARPRRKGMAWPENGPSLD